MRTKAIPIDKPDNTVLIIAGTVALAAAGYFIYTQNASANDSAGANSVSETSAPLSTPMAGQLIGGGGGSADLGAILGAIALSGGNPNETVQAANNPQQVIYSASSGGDVYATQTGISPLDQQLLDFEKYKFDVNANLQYNDMLLAANLAVVNAQVSMQAIASTNYQTAAQIANTFMTSNNQASLFTLSSGLPGGDISFTGVNARNSDKNGWDYNLTTMINSGVFKNFADQVAGMTTRQSSLPFTVTQVSPSTPNKDLPANPNRKSYQVNDVYQPTVSVSSVLSAASGGIGSASVAATQAPPSVQSVGDAMSVSSNSGIVSYSNSGSSRSLDRPLISEL